MFKRLKNPFEKESFNEMHDQEHYAYTSVNTASETPPRVFEMHPRKDSPIEEQESTEARYTRYRSSMLDLDEELEEQDSWDEADTSHSPTRPSFLDEETPETTIGKGVSVQGELSFNRLLRIDGTFEGKLVSEGKLIVGPSGIVKSNLELSEALIEGRIEGDITVSGRLELRGEAEVQGNISARTLSIDEGVTLVGQVRVLPHQEAMDLQGV